MKNIINEIPNEYIVYLNASPIGKKKSTKKELNKFYKSLGFEIMLDESNNTYMIKEGESKRRKQKKELNGNRNKTRNNN